MIRATIFDISCFPLLFGEVAMLLLRVDAVPATIPICPFIGVRGRSRTFLRMNEIFAQLPFFVPYSHQQGAARGLKAVRTVYSRQLYNFGDSTLHSLEFDCRKSLYKD